MTITDSDFNNEIYNNITEYKDSRCCGKIDGRNCNKLGKHKLRVSYIDKVGLFCDLCADELLNSKLVNRVE